MSLTLRLTAAVVLVLLIHGGVVLMREGGIPTHVEPPAMNLEAMPFTLAEWEGHDVELDPRLFQAAGASDMLGRMYQRPGGPPISVHLALITNYGEESVHHFPEACYVFNGYEITDRQRRTVRVGEEQLPVHTSTWERSDEQAQILYWYQFGPDIFLTKHQLRAVRRHYWGESEWPPVIKVLLHVSTSNPRAARDELEHFAVPLYEWTRKLNP